MKLLVLFLVFPIVFAQDETQVYSDAEERLVQDLFKNYSKQFLPPHNKTNPTLVSFYLSLINIKSLDPVEQILRVETWLHFQWNDSRLTWDPENYDGMKRLRIDISHLWRPDITLYNSADTNMIEFTEGSKTKHVVISNTGGVTWIPAASLATICRVDMKYYPFDSHACALKFGSWVFDGHHLDLEIQKSKGSEGHLEQLANNTEWEVLFINGTRTEKYYSCCEEPYVDVMFTLNLARARPMYEGAILFPFTAGVMLAIFAFLIPPFAYTRIQLNAFLLFLFTFSLFHIFHKFPSVGRQVPAIVLVGEMFVILTSLSIVWNVIVHALSERLKSSPAPACIQRLLSTWPIKVIGQSRHENSFQMNAESNKSNRDPEGEAIVVDESKSVNNWQTFLIFLDRLAFIFYVIIVVAFLIALTR